MNSEQNELLSVFVSEATERLDDLDALLGEIEEQTDNRQVINEFMRSAHTLKGSAGVAGVAAIETLAHIVESVVEQLREGKLQPTPEVFDRLSLALDAISRALPSVRSGEKPEVSLGEAADSLRKWLDETTGSQEQVAERRASAEGFSLGEYDQVRIRVLQEQQKSLFVVQVTAPAGLGESAVWAKSVLKAARPMGACVATHPQPSSFDELRSGSKLSLLLGTSAPEKEIEDAFGNDMAAGVLVRPYQERVAQNSDSATDRVSSAVVADRTVRVDLEVLDDLLRLVGELMINRDRYRQVAKQLGEELLDAGLASEIDDSAGQLGHLTGELQDAIMRARMVPIARIFRATKRTVRRTVRDSGSSLDLQTRGDDTELDKSLVDSIAEVFAGFVAGFVRDTEGERFVTIQAVRRWNHVILTVDSSLGATKSQQETLRAAVSQTGGTVETQRVNGVHRCSISLPLTLAIIRVMMTSVGDEVYAFPIESVKETLKILPQDIVFIEGSRVTELRGSALSLIFLDEFFGVRTTTDNRAKRVLVLGEGDRQVGVVVDQLVGIREVVIKPLSPRFASVREVSGCAILGDDQIALVLNAEVLVEQAISSIAEWEVAARQRLGSRREERSTL